MTEKSGKEKYGENSSPLRHYQWTPWSATDYNADTRANLETFNTVTPAPCTLSNFLTHSHLGQVFRRKIIFENKKHCPDLVNHCLPRPSYAFPSWVYSRKYDCVTTHSFTHKVIIIFLPNLYTRQDPVSQSAFTIGINMWVFSRICYVIPKMFLNVCKFSKWFPESFAKPKCSQPHPIWTVIW